jgi:ribosomal protein RSM22 (predicted rRNA methylase)
MRLPEYLKTAIEELSARADSKRLAAACRQLTERYKGASSASPAVRDAIDRIAYLSARLPATFAANMHVLTELRRRAPGIEISTLLDLGAGPGTALFAAAEMFLALRDATLLEADPQWLTLGQQLASASPFAAVRTAQWMRGDLRANGELQPHDLVVISYAMGELAQNAAEAVIRRAWHCARKFLVVVEPGTRRGFAVLNAVRSFLIAQHADILAPCPHQDVCPMAAANDWCHFSQRLERTSEHRRIKSGSLGYEDEKFSYLIATRLNLPPAQTRIVRHPHKHSGHVQLELCTAEGLIKRTVTKSNKEAYRRARQAEWGEEFTE